MWDIRHQNTVYDGLFALPAGAVGLEVLPTPGFPVALRFVDYTQGLTQTLALVGDHLRLDPLEGLTSGDWQALPQGGGGLLGADLREAVERGTWEASGSVTYLRPGGLAGDQAVLVAWQQGSAGRVVLAQEDGLVSYAVGGDGQLQQLAQLTDTETRYLGGTADLALVTLGGSRFLYSGSALEHGISGFRLSDSGQFTEVESFGRNERLPVQGVSALEVAEVGGESFLVVAAAGSSSLTVLRVLSDGRLEAVDHMLDDAVTRFGGVTHLEVVQVAGRSLVLAAGADGGISLLTLTQSGRLVHLDTVSDSAGVALEALAGLVAVEGPDGVEIMTLSGGAAGLSHFRLSLPEFGQILSRDSGLVQGTGRADLLALGQGKIGRAHV